MDTLPGISARRQSSAPYLIWSLIGVSFRPTFRQRVLILRILIVRMFNTTTVQLQAVYYVISPRRIHNMRSSSSSLSPSTSVAITCTCTGTRFWLPSTRLGLTYPRSSLITGSKSHKLVTSDVSRILWFYYNDPVRFSHPIQTRFSLPTNIRQRYSSSVLEMNSSSLPSTSLTG